MRVGVLLVAAAGLGAMSCSSSIVRCSVPGDSTPCTCTDGRMGAHVCGPDGTFGMCVCTAPGADMGTDARSVDEGLDAPAVLDSGLDAGTDGRVTSDLGTDAPADGGATVDGGGGRIVQVALAVASGYALSSDGTVYSWGLNAHGALGDGTTTDRASAGPVVGISDAAEVTGGGEFACVRRTTGAVKCWGQGIHGTLGTGSTTDAYTPGDVPGISDAIAISAGGDHVCVIGASGMISCWGEGPYGELGPGVLASRTPVVVPGVPDPVAISVGGDQVVALARDGTVYAWGLGDAIAMSTTMMHPVPATVGSPPLMADEIVAGTHHTCVRTGGSVSCFGQGSYELGTASPVPAGIYAVTAISTATSLAAGLDMSCAVLADGSESCWGRNFTVQLGHVGSDTELAMSVGALLGVGSAAHGVGNGFACALETAGIVDCWGANDFGQLGRGAPGVESPFAAAVIGLPTP